MQIHSIDELPYRLSIISPIVTISRLSFVSVYSTIFTKYIMIAYKICYKGSLDFGRCDCATQASSKLLAEFEK